MKISYDQIFGIKRENVDIEREADIANPKIYAKASIHGVPKSKNGELPKQVRQKYSVTMYSCESKSPTNS